MDLMTASVYELRGELRRLKRTIENTPVSQMERGDLVHTIRLYREMSEKYKNLPMLIDNGSGKLPPRIIHVEDEEIDGEIISIPLAPAPRKTSANK